MPARSLNKMATQACIKNIGSILDVGEAPYELVRPLLVKLQNPEQLRQIELNSRQICELDGEVWLQFIKRDVPNWDKKPHEPRNPNNWHKIYRKLCAESKRELEDDGAALKAEMDRIKNEQAKNTIHRVELNIVKVPEGMVSHGRTIKPARKPDLHDRVMQVPPNPNERVKRGLDGEGDRRRSTRTAAPPPTKGKLKLKQFRKEAKAIGHFSHQQQNRGQPGVWKAQDMRVKPVSVNQNIVTAPRCLIDEHRKPASPRPIDPSIKPPTVFAPRKRRIEHDATSSPVTSINEERENRLRAFTNPSSVKKSAPASNLPKSTPIPDRSNTHTSASTSAAAASLDQLFDEDIPMSSIENSTTLTIPKPPIATPIISPPETSARDSPASGYRIPRPNTSSPSNGGVRRTRPMKSKAPVDIFMPHPKRQRLV
ncbi:hypothetical protein OEA41_002338 [Lepraria neglecta]|uniref:Elongin-A n=1 Tax=Lepraria neglecta TaxID=209136 RepID=A0AAD9ZEW8_9LECA|nr:hypothetical protein OEA41_002338 [Lepraria neglecta]